MQYERDDVNLVVQLLPLFNWFCHFPVGVIMIPLWIQIYISFYRCYLISTNVFVYFKIAFNCRHVIQFQQITCQLRQTLHLNCGAYWSTGWLKYVKDFHHPLVGFSFIMSLPLSIVQLMTYSHFLCLSLLGIVGTLQIWFDARNTLSHCYIVGSIYFPSDYQKGWYAVSWSYSTFAGFKIWGFLAS